MRKLLSFFLAFTAFCLSGCLDVLEDVTINEDGSGVYKTAADMSGIFDLIQMAAMMDTSANSELKKFADKDIDSIIALQPMADTATNLSAEDKALLRDANMHIVMKQSDRLFKMTMTYPFKKLEDIEKIIKLHEGGKGFNPMSKLAGKESMEGMGEGMPNAGDFMDIEFRKGSITRKIDDKKLEEIKKDEDLNNAKAEAVLSKITFTTSIRLPKAVSSAKGDKISVSDDKRTVLIKSNMLDIMKNPKAMEFKIEY